MRRFRITAAAVLVAMSLSACGGNGDDNVTAVPASDSGDFAEKIVDIRWSMSTIKSGERTMESPAGANVHLKIGKDGKVAASTGCNAVGGTAEITDGEITFTEVYATKRLCRGELGELEKSMFKVLKDTVKAEVSDHSLTLVHPKNGSLTLHRG